MKCYCHKDRKAVGFVGMGPPKRDPLWVCGICAALFLGYGKAVFPPWR